MAAPIKPKPAPATQKYLDIAEIKEDVVVLKDGTLRAVLLVASINFALKSEDEQNAIIQQYVSFLNALEHPVQIVVQSRQLNVEPYLNRLREAERTQPNDLLKVQIADYRAFVQELIELGQIMQKQFFVVVPYNPLTDKQKSFWTRLQEVISPAISVRLAEDRFRKRRQDLLQRVSNVVGHLGSMGLKAVQLDTQSLIELYYRVYNPETAETQKVQDTDKLRVSDNTAAI